MYSEKILLHFILILFTIRTLFTLLLYRIDQSKIQLICSEIQLIISKIDTTYIFGNTAGKGVLEKFNFSPNVQEKVSVFLKKIKVAFV